MMFVTVRLIIFCSDAGTKGPGGGGALAPLIFSVIPIPIKGCRFCPFFTTCTPNFFHLPASLIL